MHGGNGGGGGSSSQNDNTGSSRTCTYKDFMNYKPKSCYGNKGVALARWIETMESVFHISLCTKDCKVTFPACTFVDTALTC